MSLRSFFSTQFLLMFVVLIISSNSFGFGRILPKESDSSTSTPPSTSNPNRNPASQDYSPLVWESSSKPERTSWSKALFDTVDEHYQVLNRASDITYFCPRYNSLNREERINAWGNFFASVAYYESGWNPKSASVDVGTKNNRDTWSIGLFQMSVIDQKSYGINFGYDYNDLLTAKPNINLALAIMARQIDRRGSIVLSSNVYWAVLREGGKYQKIKEIAALTKRLKICN